MRVQIRQTRMPQLLFTIENQSVIVRTGSLRYCYVLKILLIKDTVE